MTVAQLIKKLQELDPDGEIQFIGRLQFGNIVFNNFVVENDPTFITGEKRNYYTIGGVS